MKVYTPQISVKLIKAIRRKEIVPGTPVADRYNLDAIDLWDMLGDGGGLQVTKGVRDPAGGFNLTCRDQRRVDTVAALVEPMDLIEIRFCRDPLLYGSGEWPPVVMRGMVTEVTRSESMNGDQPVRTVTIAGQDFGKVLQILQVYYIYNSTVGDKIVDEWTFFHKYASSGAAKIMTANAFAGLVVNNIINPYLKAFAALANGDAVGAKVVNSWTLDASIEGVVQPWAVSAFNNVSLHQMMSQLFDVGVFNEMFVEDTKDGVKLVLRPNPFLDASGSPIQGVKAEEVTLTDKDVIAMALSRTDAGVANFYWVTPGLLPFMQNEDAQLVAQTAASGSMILFDYLNSKRSIYGIRKMEVSSFLVDPAYANVEGQKDGDKSSGTTSLLSWNDKRRKILADSNKDNVVFEAGTLQCKGDERLKAGRQLILTRANAVPVTGYITKVMHSYNPLQGFMTTLTLERMTTFIERAKAKDPQYLPEMNAEGVK